MKKGDVFYVNRGSKTLLVTYIEPLVEIDGLKRFVGEIYNKKSIPVRRVFFNGEVIGGIDGRRGEVSKGRDENTNSNDKDNKKPKDDFMFA